MPLPQRLSVQLLSQPSPLTPFPSSHSSPGSFVPLPQTVSIWQFSSQPSPGVVLPSSQLSPTSWSLLPQATSSSTQESLHPSPEALLPSSQVSPAWMKPSPHSLENAPVIRRQPP